jgi:alkanesulfonate monooxygenase SsuD/methylene tetrahydromethanopterin reductase-like flavin-dependent oxidoreductase (luciferase family)
VNFCYGVTPMEHRERYREAFALTLKAWQAREIFAWNGRYYQLAEVNLWPRPIQQPHPPVWVPGSGSISTFDFAVDNDACYCFLSYSGAKAANSMMQRYWQVVSDKGREANPYRAGFLQLVAVAVRDRLREEVVKGLRVGNLMVLLQIGSMPHEPTLENIDLFARKVLPEFRDEWNDEGWVNYWWPQQLRERVGESVPAAAGGQ